MLNLTIKRNRPILVDDQHLITFVYHDRPKNQFTLQYQGNRYTLARKEAIELESGLVVSYEGPYRSDGVKLAFHNNPSVPIRRCTGYDSHGHPIWYVHPKETT